ncbi:TenA family protein [Psychromonas sp. L1A2]|uniref:TenA family protein n=1 Tax=Psychromonas sp. L1A2 TaxID=2686356 RepID=UPI00135AB0F2|nr:TenA family protein [Psychromonas sp. L1A2]
MNHKDLINACQSDWDDYTKHPFVMQLGNGSLAQPCFLHYLKQDFLFLKQYSRAYALAIYKANTLAEMRKGLTSVQALLSFEINHHITYCANWGLTEADLEAEDEDFGTVAYTRYVLDTGMMGDIVDLYVALAPCSIGYAEIGRLLANDKNTKIEGNEFASWIDLYSGEEFQQSIIDSTEHLDQLLAEIDLNSQRGQHLLKVFRTATRMEVAFWQQGLNAAI